MPFTDENGDDDEIQQPDRPSKPTVPNPKAQMKEVPMRGKLEKAKGKVKEAVGNITGNSRLKAEGKIEQAAGTAQDKIDKFKNRIPDHSEDMD